MIEQDPKATGHAPEECRDAVAGKTKPRTKRTSMLTPMNMVAGIMMEAITSMSTVAVTGMTEGTPMMALGEVREEAMAVTIFPENTVY